jgi:hypothetical protein
MSFFYKNRNCSIKNWNILPNVRKVKWIRNIPTVNWVYNLGFY